MRLFTCREMTELSTDHLEGRLPPLARLRFRLHLAICRGCRAYLLQMRQTLRAMGRLANGATPPGVKAALLAAFRAWKRV